jgi:hypothetical protein
LSVSPELVRRRLIQACAVLVALAALPAIVVKLVPSFGRYLPPFMLSAIVLVTAGEALLAWCPQWVVAKLFPGQRLPEPLPFSQEARRNAVIATCTGVVVSLAWAVMWVRSLP